MIEAMGERVQANQRSEWRRLRLYVIPAIPLFILYLFMGALPFRLGAELGWWPVDYNTDAGEAQLLFQIAGFLALIVLAIAVPIITSDTQRGMRLRVNGTGALLLVVALPLVSWGIGLALWFL
jgi:hypothetical protein